MQSAFDQFKINIKYAHDLNSLYLYLKDNLNLPNDLTDILRAEWVICTSALDKLIHELVRIGMLEAFRGTRLKTAKFSSFGVSTNTLTSSLSVSIPPAEYWFEQEIIEKHKTLAFQAPDKISDALSHIWNENHKWQHISNSLGIEQSILTTKIKTIMARRNQIVHEADLDMISGSRNTVSIDEINDVVDFIEKLGEAIFNAVR